MTHVLVTPEHGVLMGAVACAAIDLCGRDRIWLDTGGTTHGIRVPAQSAALVRDLARVMSGLSGVQDAPKGDAADGGPRAVSVVTAPAPEGIGRTAPGRSPRSSGARRAGKTKE